MHYRLGTPNVHYYYYLASLTIIPPSSEVLAPRPMVLQSGVPPPRDPVVGGQFTGALSLVEQDGFLQDFSVVVLHLCST